MLKSFIQARLEAAVKAYFRAHPQVILIVVAGSVGKTSTKRAIATVLSESFRVRLHEGNHNTHLSAPLAILGIEYPSNVKNVFAWLRICMAAFQRIHQPADVDVIIQELGADHPGDMAQFARYLHPNIGVVTSVTPEHMEYFKTIEAVAQEELIVANISQLALINRDDIDGRFASFLTNSAVDTYGTTGVAEYRFEAQDFQIDEGYRGALIAPELPEQLPVTLKVVGEHSLRPAMGAAAVALKLGMAPAAIQTGLMKIRAVPGRMNILRGVENSILIDDTYNSSPVAASSALQTLYSLQAPQRIAVLGSMNELGESAPIEHEKLGTLCDPTLLAWVVTVGDDAEKYLAPAARARGCQVKSFSSAIDAGAFVHSVIDEGAIVLLKGSQGGIYLEEATKVLLHATNEDSALVRQSPQWLATKARFFNKIAG